MNSKGISTLELLISFIIISFISIAMFRTVLVLNDKITYYHHSAQLKFLKGNILNIIYEDFNNDLIIDVNSCGSNCYNIMFKNMEPKTLKINTLDNIFQYGMYVEELPKNTSFSNNLVFSIETFVNVFASEYSLFMIDIPIASDIYDEDFSINIVHQQDNNQ